MTFKQRLIEMHACQDAVNWVEDRTIKQAWDDCYRGDWMLWLLEEMKGEEGWLDEKGIMLLGCWCARRSLKYIPKGETRPLKAIEAKEGWARGYVTEEKMIDASNAAWDAASDLTWGSVNDLTRDAAYAAAYDTSNAAVWAASDAAWAAAYDVVRDIARYAANAAARYAAYNEESSIQADYIRSKTIPLIDSGE